MRPRPRNECFFVGHAPRRVNFRSIRSNLLTIRQVSAKYFAEDANSPRSDAHTRPVLNHPPAQCVGVSHLPKDLRASHVRQQLHGFHNTSTVGSGKISLPPRARNAASRSRNSALKLQGSTRK